MTNVPGTLYEILVLFCMVVKNLISMCETERTNQLCEEINMDEGEDLKKVKVIWK